MLTVVREAVADEFPIDHELRALFLQGLTRRFWCCRRCAARSHSIGTRAHEGYSMDDAWMHDLWQVPRSCIHFVSDSSAMPLIDGAQCDRRGSVCRRCT